MRKNVCHLGMDGAVHVCEDGEDRESQVVSFYTNAKNVGDVVVKQNIFLKSVVFPVKHLTLLHHKDCLRILDDFYNSPDRELSHVSFSPNPTTFLMAMRKKETLNFSYLVGGNIFQT